MNEFDVPILKKVYDLYRAFHQYRQTVPKQDRFTIFERSENTMLDLIECLLSAGQAEKGNKALMLERASVKLNMLRFFIRLMKETKSLDTKKYTALQEMVDEVGRMLGGWIRSITSR